MRASLRRIAGAVRLHGPLANEPKAGVLHAILLAIMVWLAFHLLVVVPWFAARKPQQVMIVGSLSLLVVIALYFLRRGSLRKAAMLYVGGCWAVFTVVILLFGGIRSPALILYAALPISAACLFGRRGAVLTTALCLITVLVLALMAMAGFGPYWYFPGVPIGLLASAVLAILISAAPVIHVMGMLEGALAQSKRDQEALRRERDLLSRVMETSPDGIVTCDREGRLTFANSRGAEVLGTSLEQIRQRTFDSADWKITASDGTELPREELPFLQVKARREAIYGMQFAVQPADSRILLSVSAAPLLGAAGEFDGMVAAVEDITQQKHIEEELRRHREHLQELVEQRTRELAVARDQANSANFAKTLFLANMSHELRTPLNAIMGFSDLLQRDQSLSDRQCEQVALIGRSGQHLLALIDDILEMSSLEAGHGRSEVAVVELIPLINDVITMMGRSATEKGIELLVEWSDPQTRLIRADGPKLRQIVANLIQNAIKYTDAGSVVVRVQCKHAGENANGSLIIEVQDTGIGIAPDRQASIFEPFVQLGEPNSRKGSGLGLAICRQFAQLMSGTIHVESAPGMGSRFWVELPVMVVDEVPADVSPDEGKAQPPAGGRPSGLSGIAKLPEDLKSQLLNAVLLLDKEHIAEVVHSISVLDPPLARELARRADALQFTRIAQAAVANETPADSPLAIRMRPAPNRSKEDSPVSAGKVLIVDDHEESLKLLTEILVAEGYAVRAADSGELALDAVIVRRPEVVLLDMRMPGMAGPEVCRRLKARADTRDIPVIFLSASLDFEDRLEGLEAGAVDFINKPFRREELLVRLKAHLELARLRNDLERRVEERTGELRTSNDQLHAELAIRCQVEAELRDSEQRFRSIADTAPAGIFISDRAGASTYMNQWIRSYAGIGLKTTGNQWQQVLHPEDRERTVETIVAAVKDRTPFQFEFRHRRSDGQYRWAACTATPRFVEGEFVGHIGIILDIEELKQSQERAMANQKLESLGVLAAGIAHDFNNLLSSILAHSDLALRETPDDSPAHNNISSITTVAVRASEIVRLLMAYAGHTDLNRFEPIDLAALLEELVPLLQVSVPKTATLSVHRSEPLPMLRANAAQVRQVVLNLVVNASEALEGKTGTVDVSTSRIQLRPGAADARPSELRDGDYVLLEVSDTGCGMTEEIKGRIFDPFFSTKFLGRGMGLAAAQGIVRGAGGAIRVTSAPGKGSTFQVWLPSWNGPAKLAEKHAPTPVRSIAGATVLLVDDEEALRFAAASALKREGFVVLEAANGLDAVQLFAKDYREIDVVVLDITMPGLSGHDVGEEIRRLKPEARVLFTTAHDSAERDDNARAGERILRKPYHLRDLAKTLREMLG